MSVTDLSTSLFARTSGSLDGDDQIFGNKGERDYVNAICPSFLCEASF